ncbi:MAG: dicarboxylate/amino acid:cation symporter, partial [Ignavibacteria bacterium]|nr:dicarboxylate/amino acid:cation symporter [Ignavibacteria bacterium]
MKKPQLHIQILIGLILGIIFGVIFKIDSNVLVVTSSDGKTKLKDWDEIKFISDGMETSFKQNEGRQVIKYFESVRKKNLSHNLIVKYNETQKEYKNVTSLTLAGTPASDIKPIGEIFIRLLNMIAVPLVLASLIVGAASLHDLKHLTKLGGRTLAFFILTCSFAVLLGQLSALIFRPGISVPEEIRTNLIHAYQQENVSADYRFDFMEFIVGIVPRNPFKGLVDGDFLQIVFFSVVIGLVLCLIPKEKSAPVINFFEGLSLALIKMVEKIVLLAPYAVFALISATVAEFGFEIVHTLVEYAATVIVSLVIVAFVIYPSLIKFIAKVNPVDFFLAQKRVIALAFTTSSSSATLPVTLDVTENRLGVPGKIASFVVPLGATLNKAGTALYQAVVAMFIAQVYGFEISSSVFLTIFITSVV